MELYGFMEREKKIPSYFFIITKQCRIVLFLQENCVFLYLYYKLSIME